MSSGQFFRQKSFLRVSRLELIFEISKQTSVERRYFGRIELQYGPAKVQGAMCYDFNRPQLFFRIEFCFFQLELWVKY